MLILIEILISNTISQISVEKYCENFFKSNTKKIDQNNIENDNDFEKSFASSLGALKIIQDGWETEAIPEIGEKNIEKIGFFAKIFGNH